MSEPPPDQDRRNWWLKTGILVIAGTVIGLFVLVLILYFFVQGNPLNRGAGATPTSKPITLAESTDSHLPAQTTVHPSTALPSTPVPAKAENTLLPSIPPDCSGPGISWRRPKDGMEMVCIPAGPFIMGMSCTFKGCESETPRHTLSLEAYWIDRTEVTNAMFEQFVTATSYVTGAEKSTASEVLGNLKPVPGADWRHPHGPESSIISLENHPVVQISWFGAQAYCQWAGGQLPTEAQWEKAARGSDGRLFPWGNTLPTGSRLNFADLSLGDAHSSPTEDDGYPYTAPVGSYPAGASPYGVLDMAGNAWEWTRTLFKPYPYSTSDGRDITDLDSTGKVVMRGGSWFDDAGSVRSTLRYNGTAQRSHDATGFRCAYP